MVFDCKCASVQEQRKVDHARHVQEAPAYKFGGAVDDLFMGQKNGQMKRISPEEDHHAFILATARDLQQDKFQEAGAVAVLAPKYITSQALSCQRRNGEGHGCLPRSIAASSPG